MTSRRPLSSAQARADRTPFGGGCLMLLGLTVYAIVLLLLGAASILLLVIIVQLAINTFSFSRGEGLDSRTTEARAEELLRTILDESEWLQLKTLRFLDVASMHYRQRFYRIPLMDGMVNVFEDGKAISGCAYSRSMSCRAMT